LAVVPNLDDGDFMRTCIGKHTFMKRNLEN
jgi:hypothetical protein